jgi:hypothetical protein
MEQPSPFTEHGGIMRQHLRSVITLSFVLMACQGRGAETSADTALSPAPADAPATSAREPSPRAVDKAADSAKAQASGKEAGTIPATPTPTVTSESSIASMRLQLQRLDTASVSTLQGRMTEHSKMLGDLLTTMRVQVQAVTAPTRDGWLATADSAENDLDKLALARGEDLRTAFRAHSTRVLRLLEQFRVLVPAGSL